MQRPCGQIMLHMAAGGRGPARLLWSEGNGGGPPGLPLLGVIPKE